MSGNKELEEGMEQAFLELQDLITEHVAKLNKKHWSEIIVPFTLHEGLSRYKKSDLDTIRKALDVRNASSLKKADLVELLQVKIREYLENIYILWDSERFKLLMTIADNGGHIEEPELDPEQIEYFRGTGLIYTGTFEEKRILAVPYDLVEQIITLKNDITIRKAINRNTNWVKLTRGLLYYYGTLSATQLVQMIEKYTKEKINFREFIRVILDANIYREEIQLDANGFSDGSVIDSNIVIQEHLARASVPYYPFTKQQLLTAGEPGYVDRNESYVQLVNFLTQNYKIDREDADIIAEECVYATKIGDSPNDIFQYLGERFEFDSMDTAQALLDKVVYLMNNTREWFLKGYTSTELFEEEKKHLQPLPTSKFNYSDNKNDTKVGRNDPCPCGSGKKYKKCCGR
ncbi:SEC-C metal-binding domain-containing protein [Calidifontibacillus oryziterrae]|uniref:SEC-C metal-binding domain-containing protein n=1 Tax=Calidifontibacillus oryziterrae TaxID=1191699 RepID=UPI0002D747B1|nr:SEC-C metal-binding domain-containing protein [Calidifontibacillus oryziterrae]